MVPFLFRHLAWSFRAPWSALRSASTLPSGYSSLSSSRLLASPAWPAWSLTSGPGLAGLCPQPACFQPIAGMKTKSALKRRCKDCFIVRRRGSLFVFCKTNPRHKQRQG